MIFLFLETASRTFNQDIEMMLLEKLGVGVIVLAAVIAGQWIIERYKARRAVWTKISEERVQHIADDWDAMNTWDCMVGDVLFHIVSIHLEKNPSLQSLIVSRGRRPELSEMLAVLSGSDQEQLKQLLREPPPDLAISTASSIAQGKIVDAAVQANRFWLGQKLYEHCRNFQGVLGTICVAVGEADLERIKTEIPNLEKARQDVLKTMKLI